MTAPRETTGLDVSALQTAPKATDVRAFRTAHANAGDGWDSRGNGGLMYVAAIAVPVFAGVLATPFFVATSNGREPGAVGAGLVVWGAVVLGILLAVFGVRATLATRWALWLRLDRFAGANGMRFSPGEREPGYAGMLFGVGSERQTEEHLLSGVGAARRFDYGTYRYTTGSGKNRSVHRWGFLAFQLDRNLPHMVLDSRANNMLGTNLPARFDRDQRLGLEGDFDDHFTLYCPREYERDALYVFTPDLMALLIDNAAPFDVEIVDDWMFVYSPGAFFVGDPALHVRLHRIMATVGSKTVRQTARYADERVPDARIRNVVAAQGKRLQRAVPVGLIITMLVFAIVIAAFLAQIGTSR